MKTRSVSALLLVLCACGGNEESATDDVVSTTETAGDAQEEAPENALGILGAVSVAVEGEIKWLSADDQGVVWVLTDTALGTVHNREWTHRAALTPAHDKLDVFHSAPSITADGQVVIAEALLDKNDCGDSGSLLWLDGVSGGGDVRQLQEAPQFEIAVTETGMVLAPIIEYKWNQYNDPPICLPAQPILHKIAAVTRDGGLQWTINLDRPAGRPTLAGDGKTAVFTDGRDKLIAFDYQSFGATAWETTIAADGLIKLSTAARGSDGTYYVAAGRELVAVGPDGAVKWQTNAGSADPLFGEPVIDGGGSVVVAGTVAAPNLGNRYWALFRFDTGGTLVETVQAPETHLHPDSFSLKGLTALKGGGAVTMATQGELILWRPTGDADVLEGFLQVRPVVLGDGPILLAVEGGKLIEAPLVAGLADSVWPTVGGSNRQDGLGRP